MNSTSLLNAHYVMTMRHAARGGPPRRRPLLIGAALAAALTAGALDAGPLRADVNGDGVKELIVIDLGAAPGTKAGSERMAAVADMPAKQRSERWHAGWLPTEAILSDKKLLGL